MSEPIENVPDENGPTDLVEISRTLICNIPFKLAFFMFVVGLLIFSNVFVENVLGEFSEAVDDDVPTSWGTTIQLLFYTMFLILFDVLIKYEWL
jgi:hypothetical protein